MHSASREPKHSKLPVTNPAPCSGISYSPPQYHIHWTTCKVTRLIVTAACIHQHLLSPVAELRAREGSQGTLREHVRVRLAEDQSAHVEEAGVGLLAVRVVDADLQRPRRL
jgi:hypothetical protein